MLRCNHTIDKKFYEEHNDTYCDLPSTFLLVELAINSHS